MFFRLFLYFELISFFPLQYIVCSGAFLLKGLTTLSLKPPTTVYIGSEI